MTCGSEYDQVKKCEEDKTLRHNNIKLIGTDYSYKHEIVWKNAIGFLIFHLLTLWGLVIMFTEVTLKTSLWSLFVLYVATEGVTVGAHRLYSHKSFKAKPMLRAALIAMQTMAGQNSVFIWVRDHRMHHRYSETDADPHNSNRGFFFSHMGWLMTKKHPYVIELGRKIDMSDLQADWMVMFQYKNAILSFVEALRDIAYTPTRPKMLTELFNPLVILLLHILRTLHTDSCMGACAFLRRDDFEFLFDGLCCPLHSQPKWRLACEQRCPPLRHGTRPYNKNIQPVESWFVSLITLGEGWHNYHHAFPWDYKAAEFSKLFNFSADLIKFFEIMGWAYDLKTAHPEVVRNRIIQVGDGTHYELGNEEAKRKVTALGTLHPLNPSYNVTYQPPGATIKKEGFSQLTL